MSQSDFDVIIIGGGLVGASLAAACAHLPCRIALIDAIAPQTRLSDDFDARSFALSHGSQTIFSSMGIWPALAKSVVPIEQIHVSERGCFGRSHFTAEKATVPALGYVIEAQDIHAVLQNTLAKHDNITLFCPAKVTQLCREDDQNTVITSKAEHSHALRAPLVVAADGGNSTVRSLLNISARQYDYRQTAIVANVGLARSHNQVAYERFTPDGPLALLPMQKQRSALVWSLPPDIVAEKMAESDEDFLASLQTAFGYRLGQFTKIGKRANFPLSLTISDEIVAPGVVLIGNASQALHPIAGQGFNLGLRDVATMAQCIRDGLQQNNLASEELLKHYAAWRKRDQQKTILFSDFVPRVFSNNWRPLSIARDLGLCVVDSVRPIKNAFLQQNMGVAGKCPDLLCGVPL